jgi:Undecaprenyl-phosphate glucose phosphotransferase
MDTRREASLRTIDFPLASSASPSLPPGHDERRSVSLTTVIGAQRVVDALGVAASGVMTAQSINPTPLPSLSAIILFVILTTIIMTNVAPRFGAYHHKMLSSLIASIGISFAAWAVAIGVVSLLVLSVSENLAAVQKWLEFWASGAATLLALNRCVTGLFLRKLRRAGRLRRAVVVVGAGPIGQRLIQKLTSAPEPDVRIVGIYDDRIARLPRFCLGHRIRGNIDDLLRAARATHIDCVFVALPLSADWRLAEIMNKLCLVPVDVRLCADNFGFQIGECDVTHINGLTTLDVSNRPLRGWRRVAKVVEDKVLAAIILALVSPIMATVAVLIRFDSPGPVLFRQKRYGLNNELIEVLKFRTLYDNARDPNAERLCSGDDPRVTRVGSFLRRTMIDELPQFINVLRGEMSIVGPRPHAVAAKAGGLLYREVVKYYDARHRMKPGITGWAQINGWRGETRTAEEIDQRVAHDLYYIQNWSIRLDLTIILRTALGAFMGFIPRKPRNPVDDAVPLVNAGRSRSAA